MQLLWQPPAHSWRQWGKKVRAEPEKDELHFQDETHLETNPSWCPTWHRKGKQPTLPGVGTHRRVRVVGSVDLLRRARVERVRAAQESAGFVRSLALLEAHQQAVQREIDLVLEHGSAPTSTLSTQAFVPRRDGLQVIWLATYAPHLNPKAERARVAFSQARCPLASGREPA
jgi:DDE superfamily endonuclease